MSHISIFKHKVTDIAALKKVCLEKGITFTQAANGEVTGDFFRGQTHSGIVKIELSKWRYPLIIDKEGQIHYDNFGSQPGSMDQFGDLLQDYNMEVVKQKIDTTVWDNISTKQENGNVKMFLTIY